MSEVLFRQAVEADIQAIVDMLADDALGATRETPGDLTPYRKAFAELDADESMLLVAAERDGVVVGTAQISFMPGLSHRGMWRAEIEAVRVKSDQRGTGLGSQLIRHCIEQARDRGCGMVQLTSNASRTDARRFYERLGFAASHVGFKLVLE